IRRPRARLRGEGGRSRRPCARKGPLCTAARRGPPGARLRHRSDLRRPCVREGGDGSRGRGDAREPGRHDTQGRFGARTDQFGGGRGPASWGGRRMRRGDVRAAILLLLDSEPRNGYQIMQELEERSGGSWRPSPGSVYPALQLLADEGFVRGESTAGSTFYE